MTNSRIVENYYKTNQELDFWRYRISSRYNKRVTCCGKALLLPPKHYVVLPISTKASVPEGAKGMMLDKGAVSSVVASHFMKYQNRKYLSGAPAMLIIVL